MTDEHQRLVSVESQSEYNVTSGKAETRIFVKMYVDAVKKGLIADIGAERWQTLCVLSSFMNANGECYPTQDQIAGALNLSRAAANRRIKALCEYRWQERPLVVKQKARARRRSDGITQDIRSCRSVSSRYSMEIRRSLRSHVTPSHTRRTHTRLDFTLTRTIF